MRVEIIQNQMQLPDPDVDSLQQTPDELHKIHLGAPGRHRHFPMPALRLHGNEEVACPSAHIS